jgi:hypothetical protein
MELLEIAKLPTAENSAIHLNPLTTSPLHAFLSVGNHRIDGVPIEVPSQPGHKIAVARIQQEK